MRKLLTLMLLALFFAGNAYSQFVSYGFMSSNGTYTEISGGTLLGTATSDDQYFTDPANPTVSSTTGPGIPIGFSFAFNGITFDRIGVNNNGWIGFGQSALTPSVNMASSSGYTPLSSTSVPAVAIHRNRIAILARDLQAQAGSSIRVETSGTTPNMVCVIQFQNYKRYGSTGTGDILNFQIRLNETANTVQLVYGTMTIASAFSPEPQVGLGGTVDTQFLNRMSTTSWSNSNAGTANTSSMALSTTIYPASGLTYTFGPMAPLAALYSSPANGSTGMPTNVSINWAPNTSGGGAPSGYRVYMGTDNPPTTIANGVDVGNVLTYTPAAPLSTATEYFWQVVPYNSIGAATGNAIYNFTTTLGIGSLEGYTTNGFGIPIGGVNISLFNGLTTLPTTSGVNGFYQYSLISAGSYTLTASLPGYNNTVLTVLVNPSATTYQNVAMLRPSMAVTPNPYSVTVNPNELLNGAINLANNGDGLLGWTATINYTSPGPNTWLTAGQTSGSVPAYNNFNVPMAFNATGLAAGTVKTAEVTFTSTPNVGVVVVPVTMMVSGVALDVPTGLTAVISNPIAGTVNLAWSFTGTRAFQFFVVKRNGVQVGTTTSLTYTENLPAYGVYSYTVQAVYDEGNSAPAGPVVIEWSNPTLVLNPTTLYNEQYPVTSEAVTFRISNTGLGTLAYSFPEYVTDGASRAPLAYCTGSGGCDEYISSVTFGTIVNTSACTNYGNYTSISTELVKGETYPITILNGNAYSTDITGVWIDWNKNELFTDAGEYYSTASAGGVSFTSNITVPLTALNGPTRMRVRLQYGGTLAPCGSTSYGEVEDYTVDVKSPTFITAVSPVAGQVAAGSFVDVVATFTSDNGSFPVGTYNATLELNTNDLANEVVMIPATMVVYNPGMLSGNVTAADDNAPVFGAVVTAGSYTTTTNEDGNYSMIVDAGTYTMSFSKTGYTSVTVTGVIVTETNTTVVNAELEEVFYAPTLVNAVVNVPDTQVAVTWGVPEPNYEALYDDGTAENYAAWALPGNMNAVKFTPAGYPATVYGGKVFVGDGSFPNNNTGFIGTTFAAVVKAADGANGMPGTTLDSITVTVNNLGWVEFTGLNATVTSGNFYLVMVQGAVSPNCAPVGIDLTIPTAYRSYSRNVTSGGAWGLSPYQDMMIRALISGPVAGDAVRLASTEVRSASKQRGMISQSPALAQSGAEGNGQYLAIQDGVSNRDVTSYKVWRVSNFDPNAGPELGTLSLLSGSVPTTSYTDGAYGPLPQGWYAYAVATNYTNGGESVKAFSNIVGHKQLVTVTCNVSLTTGGSPAGAVVSLTGQDYPYAVYTATVPEAGTIIFENVWKGNYVLLAKKVGFDDYMLTPNITSNRTFDILLAERKYVPRNLYVDGLTLVATWDEPLAIAVAEDFEGSVFPPAGWQATTQNTNGWFASTNGGSTNFLIPAHTKYAVTNDDAANGDGSVDYLITPEMDWTGLPSFRMNFASYFDGSYAQSAYVEISTDAGATWTVINTLVAAPGAWQNLEIDLAQYSGATGLGSVWVAFHADDNGEWASGWAVDDVQIASGGVPLQGYGVFLDGTLVDNTPETTFTYTSLNYGQSYLAGVAALFSSGYSELDTYRFTCTYLIPPTALAGDSPLNTDYAHLTWVAPVVPSGPLANQESVPATETQPAADVVTVSTVYNPFKQIRVPLASSRNILFDNGPLVNSPGTGSGGADESILQSDLGMSTYGSGMQQSAGNSIADDFEVTGNWTIENFEFYGYQTGSTTTSSFTGAFCRVYDGDPSAGGVIIWGDLSTNRMTSTEWSNIYRNNNGPGGATDRPVMRIVAETPGLSLAPGTYWVEWTTTGSLGSGPWCPAVTIEGETTTGNAKQSQSGAWTNLVDVGPQGMPFIINGTGGGGGQTVANLLGYNIYRDGGLAAYVAKPALEYFDLNLMPATYSYHITAVYDLTPYGFAGQTGESMIEGPIDVTVTYGYELPFTENFNTGLFETNKWSINGGNWRIAGQVGNDAPSAEFNFSPAAVDYSQSLTSYYMIGTGYIDGKIMLDFDLKHTLVNPTEEEFLAVEVYNGAAWIKVAEYKNTATFDWETKSIDITNQAKNKVFRVRFTANGASTLDIFNWLVDNVNIYRVCAPPVNLTAAVNLPAVDQVILNWEAPQGGGTGPSGWLKWDDGTNADAIGLTGGGTFSVASRYTPAQLGEFAGTSLTKIRMFPYSAGGTIVLKVWTGANASQLVLTQPVASYTASEWNEFILNTPVLVTGATELWIGYTVTHGADYVAGCDAGPAVAGFGDMISLDGSVWESMATAYSLNFNWNLQGYVESVDGVTALAPLTDNTVYGPASQLVRGNLPMLPNATVTNNTTSGSRELVGYNVWRDGVNIATTTETTYLDADDVLAIHETYCYVVTAVYEDCESPVSNEVCILLTSVAPVTSSAVSVYPNPSNSVVNIELTNDISQVVVYNYVGQVVFEQNVTKAQTIQLNVRNYESGAYLVKFVTNAGESFTKKVVVTK